MYQLMSDGVDYGDGDAVLIGTGRGYEDVVEAGNDDGDGDCDGDCDGAGYDDDK